jgi:hypothetical protein
VRVDIANLYFVFQENLLILLHTPDGILCLYDDVRVDANMSVLYK